MKYLFIIPFTILVVGMCWVACAHSLEDIIDMLTGSEPLNNSDMDPIQPSDIGKEK